MSLWAEIAGEELGILGTAGGWCGGKILLRGPGASREFLPQKTFLCAGLKAMGTPWPMLENIPGMENPTGGDHVVRVRLTVMCSSRGCM